MLDLELSWQEAAITSGCLFTVAAAARVTAVARVTARPRLLPAAAAGNEAGLLFGLFALWQYAGSFSVLPPTGALARAGWIWHAERVMHLPSEAAIQRVFLPYPLLIQFFNLYYAGLHFIALIACLIWLFARHRRLYRQVRTTVVLFTAGSLLIQFIPVAPPRMLPADHMIDTGILYHQSVYGSVAGFNPDQLSAMPSVHIGWALIVALAVIAACRTRWRWLALSYPALTTLAVIVTANHFWLDGIVAAALLALVLMLQRSGRAAWDALRAAPTTEPTAAGGPAQPALARSRWVRLAVPLSPALARYVISASSPHDGEEAEALVAAAASAEARPAAPPWRPPPPGPPGPPEPECGRKPSESR